MAKTSSEAAKANESCVSVSEDAENAKLNHDIRQLYATLHQREVSSLTAHVVKGHLFVAYVFSIRGDRNPHVEGTSDTALNALRDLKTNLRHQVIQRMSLLLQTLNETE